MNRKFRFWVSLVVILLFSAILNQLILDNKAYRLLSKERRNFIEVSAVAITGLIGYIYYYKPKIHLARKFWLIGYGVSTFFLLIIAIVDNYIIAISTQDGQYRFGTMKDYLISPLYFVLVYIFQMVMHRSMTNSQKHEA